PGAFWEANSTVPVTVSPGCTSRDPGARVPSPTTAARPAPLTIDGMMITALAVLFVMVTFTIAPTWPTPAGAAERVAVSGSWAEGRVGLRSAAPPAAPPGPPPAAGGPPS